MVIMYFNSYCYVVKCFFEPNFYILVFKLVKKGLFNSVNGFWKVKPKY